MKYLQEKLSIVAAMADYNGSGATIFQDPNEMRYVQCNGYYPQIKTGVDFSASKGNTYKTQEHMQSIELMRHNRECPEDFRNNGQIKDFGDVCFLDITAHQKQSAIIAGSVDFDSLQKELAESISGIMSFRLLSFRAQK